MQLQGTQFQRNQSSVGYQWESCWQPDYDDKVEGVINLDDLLMQFKDTIESMQQAFRITATQISKLVDDMANTGARQEEKCVEIETYQESIFQVTSIHHQMTTEEEAFEVSSTPEYSCSTAAGYVRGTEKGRLELTVEDQKVSFDIFEAMKHSDMGDACSKEEEVEQEIVLTTSTMIQHFPLEKKLGDEIDSLVDNEECDDPKHNYVNRVVFEKMEKMRPPEKPKAELKTLPAHLKYIFLEDDKTKPVIISNSLKKEEEDQLVKILKRRKAAIGWHILDLKGISHHIVCIKSIWKPILNQCDSLKEG